MVRINQFLIRHSDRFFGYQRPTDFRLEERHPELFPTNVRPETLAQDAALKQQAAEGKIAESAVSALHLAGADAVPGKRSGECALVSRARAQGPSAPGRQSLCCRSGMPTASATIRSAPSSTRWGFRRCGSRSPTTTFAGPPSWSAPTTPSAPTSAARSRPAARRWWTFAAAWTGWKSRATSTSACWEPASAPATPSWPAPTTRASG